MSSALIGHSGFVGECLKKQTEFDDFFRSTNIETINNRKFNTIVCAGAPAKKWIANKHPDDDAKSLQKLMSNLSTVKCDHFVLISTVDVFGAPIDVNETTNVDTKGLHAYGAHRRQLEIFVEEHFENYTIVRLPGLVGPGLKKNVIFDFLNNNNVEQIDSRGVFQFYPMVNLWRDIEIAILNNLRKVHLTAEPVRVADVAKQGFNISFRNEILEKAARYDFQSVHAELFGGKGKYQYSERETMMAIRAYAQSESKAVS